MADPGFQINIMPVMLRWKDKLTAISRLTAGSSFQTIISLTNGYFATSLSRIVKLKLLPVYTYSSDISSSFRV